MLLRPSDLTIDMLVKAPCTLSRPISLHEICFIVFGQSTAVLQSWVEPWMVYDELSDPWGPSRMALGRLPNGGRWRPTDLIVVAIHKIYVQAISLGL